MKGPLRSKQGCWTCRLRRKKCDEKHPLCSICESLKIICYGYGEKPDWMDNGEKEKAIANNIKQIVKKTSRQKGRLGISMSRFQGRSEPQKEDGPVKIAPKSTNVGTGHPTSVGADANAQSSGESGSPATLVGTCSAGASPGSTEQNADGPSESSLSWLSAIKNEEAVLLMHFIDIVFPLQYPMYKPSVIDGGRGWLLSLLLRTKPLYHASLALSAYHRGTVFVTVSSPCSTFSTVDQEKHLAICLLEFQQAIKDVGRWVNSACPSNSLGLMACVIQLVFFELFAGHANTWQIHLNALTDIFCKGYWDQATELGLVDSPDMLFDKQATPIKHEGRAPPEEAAIFMFLSGVTVWLDVLSCITSGKSPRLLSFHPHAISCTSAIKLENIMGCKNWAILQIARIAALHQDRIQALQQGPLHTSDLETRTDDIRQTLRNGLTEYSLASLEISSHANFAFPPLNLNPELYIITRIFTLTASIYLYLVIHGYQLETHEVRSIVTEAMTILRTKMPSHLMHAIICPLYIIGSVAKREDEQFFRNVFSSAPVLDPSLEHRGKILPLLEELWRMRDTTMTGWTWQDTVTLSDHSLLLL